MSDLRIPRPIQRDGGIGDWEKFVRGDITVGIQGRYGKAGDDAIWRESKGD
jgi:hypothetical protein